MRHVATDAEMRLWSRLRGRRLRRWKFRRQHTIGGFILDFYCPEAGLAIELDGGGHAMAEQAAYDQERERRLADTGVRVLRFWDDQALKDTATVLEVIANALENPLTLPSPPGGRGMAVPLTLPSPPGGRGMARQRS